MGRGNDNITTEKPLVRRRQQAAKIVAAPAVAAPVVTTSPARPKLKLLHERPPRNYKEFCSRYLRVDIVSTPAELDAALAKISAHTKRSRDRGEMPTLAIDFESSSISANGSFARDKTALSLIQIGWAEDPGCARAKRALDRTEQRLSQTARKLRVQKRALESELREARRAKDERQVERSKARLEAHSQRSDATLRTLEAQVAEAKAHWMDLRPQQFVFDCHAVDTTPLTKLFHNRRVEKQIHNLDYEQEKSLIGFGISIENIYDTRVAWQVIQAHLDKMGDAEREKAGFGHLKRREMKRHQAATAFFMNKLDVLCKETLGITIPKDEQTSDWSRRPLSSEQLVYAAMDVTVLPKVVEETKKVVKKLGLEDEVAEAIRAKDKQVRSSIQKAQSENRYNDESDRVFEAFDRARTVEQLDLYWEQSRQMPVLSWNFARLQEVYLRRREELAAAVGF